MNNKSVFQPAPPYWVGQHSGIFFPFAFVWRRLVQIYFSSREKMLVLDFGLYEIFLFKNDFEYNIEGKT